VWRSDVEIGEHFDAIDEPYGVLADYPLRVGFWGQLMRGLSASGRQAEALDAYRRARDLLMDELGVEPGDGLHRVHREILAGTHRRVS
jgi:hypothetical protein